MGDSLGEFRSHPKFRLSPIPNEQSRLYEVWIILPQSRKYWIPRSWKCALHCPRGDACLWGRYAEDALYYPNRRWSTFSGHDHIHFRVKMLTSAIYDDYKRPFRGTNVEESFEIERVQPQLSLQLVLRCQDRRLNNWGFLVFFGADILISHNNISVLHTILPEELCSLQSFSGIRVCCLCLEIDTMRIRWLSIPSPWRSAIVWGRWGSKNTWCSLIWRKKDYSRTCKSFIGKDRRHTFCRDIMKVPTS